MEYTYNGWAEPVVINFWFERQTETQRDKFVTPFYSLQSILKFLLRYLPPSITDLQVYCFIFFKDFIYLFFRQGKEKEREGNINVLLPLGRPPLGTWPTTQACALTGNQTSDPFICRLALKHWATPARVYCLIFMHVFSSHPFYSMECLYEFDHLKFEIISYD